MKVGFLATLYCDQHTRVRVAFANAFKLVGSSSFSARFSSRISIGTRNDSLVIINSLRIFDYLYILKLEMDESSYRITFGKGLHRAKK